MSVLEAPRSRVQIAPQPATAATPDCRPLGSPWPADARELGAHTANDLTVGGLRLADLADRYGTPLYVLDEAEVRARARAYRNALPNASIHYAAKAFLCGAMADWIRDEGLGLDVCSHNELALALAHGFPAARIILHGNAKTEAELRLAVRSGVGRVVVDSFSEIAHLAALAASDRPQGVYVRVVPGVEAGHHAAVRTGVDDQQFGFPLRGREGAAEAVARILAQPRLRLAGLHCHLGSQISQTGPYLEAADRLVDLLAALRERHGVGLAELDLGGGHAIAYRHGESDLDPARLAARLLPRLRERCAARGIRVPHLVFEPGRAIAGPAGVALYRVLAVKHSAAGTRFVAVDGGMSDNPRPALYGAAYCARLVGRHAGPLEPARVVGRHCEAGDVLIRDAHLPSDTRPGDLLAVPASGAYQLSMASGYNLAGRPALVGVRDGAERLLQRRETLEDILRREAG
ncbi:MAG TPA: diaminopimelate decarboxylase [Actinocrinis sp.]